jgi:hypothetical protein
MGVALAFSAVMSQLKVPRSFLHERPVDHSRLHERLERSIDCDFVQSLRFQTRRDLVLLQWARCLHEHLQNGDACLRAIQLGSLEHTPHFFIKVGSHG